MWIGLSLILLGLVIVSTVLLVLRTQRAEHDQEIQRVAAVQEALTQAKAFLGRDANRLKEAESSADLHKKALQEIYQRRGMSADEIVDRFRKLGF